MRLYGCGGALFAHRKQVHLFIAAQNIINNNPRVKADKQLRNAFAGLAFCVHCNHGLYYNGCGGKRDGRIECRKKPPHFKSVKYTEVVSAVISALELSELPALEAQQKNNAGSSIAIQQQLIKNLEEEMKGYHEQEETQYELLETKRYTQELFEKRNAALRQKMGDCEARLKKARMALPNAIDYAKKTAQLKEAIQALKDNSKSPLEQNRFLKSIINRIEIETIDKGFKNTELKLRIYLRL